ncbi:MAG: aminodeoxychorismate lyase [Gammaproteobacteria bacterium]
MNERCWINGEPGTLIAAADRGLQYGDGVFETMAVRHGRIVLLEMHLQRLVEGCERLGIPPPSVASIHGELNAAVPDQERAILKLIVTRGSSGRGYRPAQTVTPTRILALHDWPAYPESWWQNGIHVRICKTILGGNPQLAGVKHLNRLEQVLARAEWSDADSIQEGLMTDADGAVIEGTMTNVFARLADGTVTTPDVSVCGVAGVMRRYIMERAEQMSVPIRVSKLTIQELNEAQEIFVCNSVIGVWPVNTIGEWSYPVGEMTREIQQWTDEL